MWRSGVFAVAVLVAVGTATCIVRAPEGPTAVALKDYPTRALELPNGMRVLLEEAPDFGASGAVLVVGAGSADNPAGKAGLAHLAEHLAFGATHAGVSLREWSRNLTRGVNATTTWDTTTYHAVQPTSSLPAIVTFLHGVVTEPLAGIDEPAFQREWRAVSNERRMGTEEGTPGQTEGWLIAASFPPSDPYGRPPVGTRESLSRLTLADVRAFVGARYRPESCTLAISAPLPLDAQQKLVESITGLPARPARLARHAPAKPAPLSLPRSFETRDADVATPTLWIGWQVPADTGPGGDVAPVVVGALAESAFSELGDRDHDVGTLRTGVIGGVAASLFYVRVSLKQAAHPAATARAVVEQLHGALGRLTAVGFPTSHLTQVVATDYVYRQEPLLQRMYDAAWSAQHLGDPTFLRKRGDRMIRLTYADVATYIQTFLKDEQAHVLLVRPGRSGDGEALSPSLPSPLVAAAAVVPAAPPVAPAPAVSVPDGDDLPALAGMQSRDLANGLHVIVVPRKGSPFHTAVLGFRGGVAQATPPGVVTAMLWGRRWSEMTPRLNGIDWSSRVGVDATFDELHATGSDVAGTVKHLSRMLRGFSMFWPPKEFDKRVEVFERNDRAIDVTFNRRMEHAVYGEQPLGTRVTAKQIQKSLRPTSTAGSIGSAGRAMRCW